jgi:hypothetical protein
VHSCKLPLVKQSKRYTARKKAQVDVCVRRILINAEASMGGYGSGRRSDRPSTDECLRINLSNLNQLGMLNRHCMGYCEQVSRRYGNTIANLTLVTDVSRLKVSPRLIITGYAFGKVIDCIIQLKEYPLPNGGERWFALCPRTGNRCAALVLPPGQVQFASVKGWNVAYTSSRENEVNRAFRAISQAETRLKAMSSQTRKLTRERLEKRLIERHMFVEEQIDKLKHMVFKALPNAVAP